jgi:hypothetical protein
MNLCIAKKYYIHLKIEHEAADGGISCVQLFASFRLFHAEHFAFNDKWLKFVKLREKC